MNARRRLAGPTRPLTDVPFRSWSIAADLSLRAGPAEPQARSEGDAGLDRIGARTEAIAGVPGLPRLALRAPQHPALAARLVAYFLQHPVPDVR